MKPFAIICYGLAACSLLSLGACSHEPETTTTTATTRTTSVEPLAPVGPGPAPVGTSSTTTVVH